MRLAIAMLALAFGADVAAQGMFKCKDAAGKITYAGAECRLLGLQPAGEVSGRANVAPAVRPSTQQSAPVNAPGAAPVNSPGVGAAPGMAPSNTSAEVPADGVPLPEVGAGAMANDPTGEEPAAASNAPGAAPDRRCFTRQVKTAKGFTSVTNCNDTPGG